MGVTGPVPNRSTDLARPRERKGEAQRGTPVTNGQMRPVSEPLEPGDDWHPIAVELYNSLRRSGQCDFYQDSDWAYAWNVCEELSHYKQQKRRSGQMFQSINSAMERLLVTEGDRRRVRLELQEIPSDEEDAAKAAISSYKDGLGVVQGGKS